MASVSERTLRISEREFLQQVRDLGRLCGWLCYHTHNSRHSEPGFTDIVMVRPPSVLFAELKTDRGRVTPAQRTWLEALEQCPGVEAYVWRPGDWPAIVERLQTRDKPGSCDTPRHETRKNR